MFYVIFYVQLSKSAHQIVINSTSCSSLQQHLVVNRDGKIVQETWLLYRLFVHPKLNGNCPAF